MPYTDRTTMEQAFGTSSIAQWASLDGEPNDVTSQNDRIDLAIEFAAEEIDNELRNAGYTVPFADPCPNAIKEIATVLAAQRLYEARGQVEATGDDGTNRLSARVRQVKFQLWKIKTRKINIDRTNYASVVPLVRRHDDATD